MYNYSCTYMCVAISCVLVYEYTPVIVAVYRRSLETWSREDLRNYDFNWEEVKQ